MPTDAHHHASDERTQNMQDTQEDAPLYLIYEALASDPSHLPRLLTPDPSPMPASVRVHAGPNDMPQQMLLVHNAQGLRDLAAAISQHSLLLVGRCTPEVLQALQQHATLLDGDFGGDGSRARHSESSARVRCAMARGISSWEQLQQQAPRLQQTRELMQAQDRMSRHMEQLMERLEDQLKADFSLPQAMHHANNGKAALQRWLEPRLVGPEVEPESPAGVDVLQGLLELHGRMQQQPVAYFQAVALDAGGQSREFLLPAHFFQSAILPSTPRRQPIDPANEQLLQDMGIGTTITAFKAPHAQDFAPDLTGRRIYGAQLDQVCAQAMQQTSLFADDDKNDPGENDQDMGQAAPRMRPGG